MSSDALYSFVWDHSLCSVDVTHNVDGSQTKLCDEESSLLLAADPDSRTVQWETTSEEPIEEGRDGDVSPGEELTPKKTTRVFIYVIIPFCVAGFGGFVPSYVKRFSEGTWYLNALRREPSNAPPMLVSVHAGTALLWLSVIAVQTWGAAGAPQGSRRKVHRFVGRYVAPIVLTTQLSLAVLAEVLYNPFWCATLGNAVVIIVPFGLGIQNALRERYVEHKLLMFMAISNSCIPGILRCAWYLTDFLNFRSCTTTDSHLSISMAGSVAVIPTMVFSWILHSRTDGSTSLSWSGMTTCTIIFVVSVLGLLVLINFYLAIEQVSDGWGIVCWVWPHG